MVYSCRSSNCKASFATERGLSSHRASCIHYRRHEAAALAKCKNVLQKLRAERAEALAKVRAEVQQKQDQASSSHHSAKMHIE